MSFTVIIPARLKSSRLPDKPLADICGRPMIVRVAERALSCGADRVVVAVDDASVYEACAAAGLDVIMTDPHHPTGTDRLAEAVAKIGLADDEIVVNLQGDEPLMPLNVIRDVADLLASRPDCAMATAAHTIHNVESFFNPNVVKVVLDDRGPETTSEKQKKVSPKASRRFTISVSMPTVQASCAAFPPCLRLLWKSSRVWSSFAPSTTASALRSWCLTPPFLRASTLRRILTVCARSSKRARPSDSRCEYVHGL